MGIELKNINMLGFSEIDSENAEFIPLLSSEEEENMSTENIPELLPILSLKNMVLFPGVVMPITASRDKSIKVIEDAYRNKTSIGVITQKNRNDEDPDFDALHSVGTVAIILRTLKMPDGNTTVIIQGKQRFRMLEIVEKEPYLIAKVVQETDPIPESNEIFDAMISSVKDMAIQAINLNPSLPQETSFVIKNIDSPRFLVNFISHNLDIEVAEKQKLLEIKALDDRLKAVMDHLNRSIQLLTLKKEIQSKVKDDMDKQQRDFFLNQQLKTIQEELGTVPGEEDMKALNDKAQKKKWNKTIRETFEKELEKLQRIHPHSPDYSVQLNYLNILVDLPWNEYTKDNFDLKHAQNVLDKDHFGLDKVKERIVEYIAVLKLKKDMKSPILCLVGPPGVGKTSLGKSIAEALGRKYIRMSLGGLRDEAEIRGHRKTYIGAMPGRIIQNIKKANSSNPVFVLDEIDKIMGMSHNGDPQSALLEVLDPEQNTTFHDNFLEIDYDLSKILFIATANSLNNVHPALKDRMEVIDVSGYIEEEKLEIAKRHLVPKQLTEHGLKAKDVLIEDGVILHVIENYTRESGVRQLEKNIGKIIRKKAITIANNDNSNPSIHIEDVRNMLGLPVFDHTRSLSQPEIGVVTGLAWTAFGGEILFIEACINSGKGKGVLTMTGNLGDVMKESAILAFEYIKSHAETLNINTEDLENKNIHIHIPEGATPKDGPSAGIALFTALYSCFTQKPVRSNLAMTGEITLRGTVLPVGGIKEKILAAKRAKINHVVLPIDNKRDVEEIKQEYLQGLQVSYIEKMNDIYNFAFEKI